MPSDLELGVASTATEIVYSLTREFNPTGEEAALIESVIAFAKGAREIVVGDAASYDGAGQALREVATLTKGVDAKRKERTAPIDETKRQWMDFFRQAEDALKAARASLDKQRLMWEAEQKRIVAEQQRKANEAAEKERKRFDALAAKAVERGDAEKAVQHAERAAAVTAPIIATPLVRTAGVGSRTYWHFEVLDQTLLQQGYLLPNLPALQKLVDSAHENAPSLVNGAIRVWSDSQSLVRAK